MVSGCVICMEIELTRSAFEIINEVTTKRRREDKLTNPSLSVQMNGIPFV